MRIREDIRWALEGYDESCLEGSERVCILSDEFGYQPGDAVPFLASFSLPEELSDMRGIFRMKVAATYHGKITDFKAVMPIATYEQLCSTATQAHQQLGTGMEWPFDLSSFLFTVKDNYQLEELKGYLTEQGPCRNVRHPRGHRRPHSPGHRRPHREQSVPAWKGCTPSSLGW